MSFKVVATNRKARHNYYLTDSYEAGISLKGSEIKSIRAGQISIKEAYVQIENQEAWLLNSHVAPYEQASYLGHEPRRKRKLLLHRKEIDRLWEEVRKKGLTIVPTRVYIKNGRAKIEIAVGRGKKQFDKRHEIAKRDAQRDMERNMRKRDY
ncbi:SsrA-binding protein SmpB [Chloroflexota bacterium]